MSMSVSNVHVKVSKCQSVKVSKCRSNVIMSGISKIKMSGFILNRVRFFFTKESLHEEGHFKDESKRD